MPPLVIFDCDGVLLESEFLANQVEVDSLKELGYHISMEDYLDIALGRHNSHVTGVLKEKFGICLTDQYWKDVIEKQWKVFDEQLVSVNGIESALQAIKTKKCVASSSPINRLNYTLGLVNLLPYFDNNIFSTQFVSRSKPFPDIFFYSAEKMKVLPNQCVVIEDSLPGIEAARAAGMTVFAFGGGKHITSKAREKLKSSGAHLFFDNMHDLPQLLKTYITNKSS